MRRKSVIICICTLLLFSTPAILSGDRTEARPGYRVFVSPPHQEHIVSDQGSVTGVITVYNADTWPVQMRAYVMDWAMRENGEIDYAIPCNAATSCANWTSLNPTEFVIPPMTNQQVRYTIDVPTGKKGGYWSVIFFESVPQFIQGQSLINFQIRLGSFIYVAIRGTERRELILEDLTIYGSNDPKSSAEISVTVRNTGNVQVRPSIDLSINDEIGKPVVDTTIISDNVILPNSIRRFTRPLKIQLPKNEYTALVTIEYDGDQIVAGQMTFTMAQ